MRVPLGHNSLPVLNALKLVMQGFTPVVGLMGHLFSPFKIGPPRIIDGLSTLSGRISLAIVSICCFQANCSLIFHTVVLGAILAQTLQK